MRKRMTRKQARAWLCPMRQAMAQIKGGEVETVRGYPVTKLHDGDKPERTDWCVNGFVALIERLDIGLDLGPAQRLSKKLEHGVLLTVAEVDSVLALLNQVENRLVGLQVAMVKDAVTTEQINIEFEALGLKKAA
jgi:hypothetical protein